MPNATPDAERDLPAGVAAADGPPADGGDGTGAGPAPAHADRSRTRLVHGLVLAALVVVSCGVNLGHMWRYREVSPIDEAQHLDSLIRIPRGDLIGAGEKFSQETAHIQTCHRIDSPFDAAVPPCTPDDVPLDVDRFQEEGYNTAFIHPPTYYLVDGVLARAVDLVWPGDHDLLTTGRVAGLVWVVGSVVFLWLLLAELRAGLVARSALILLAVTAPTVLHGSATVNPDGTALVTGAALLWAVLRWERRAAPVWLPLAFTVLAAATKVTNLVGVGAVVVYLVARAAIGSEAAAGPWQARWSPAALKARFWAPGSAARRLLGLAAWILVVVGVVSFAWLVAQRLLEEVPPSTIPMNRRFEVAELPLAEMAASWHQTVSPFLEHYVPAWLATRPVLTMAGVVDLLLVAGAVAGTVLAGRRTRERALGGSTLVLLPLIGPGLVLFNGVLQSIYVVIPSRYGLSVVPALLASSVPALRRRFPLVVAAVVALAALAAVVGAILWPAV